MNNPDTMEAVLAELEPRITVRNLAENMCSPLWRAKKAAIAEEMMISINQMEELEATVLPEIQKALIDEFVASLDSSDDARRKMIANMMATLIPKEVNEKIMAAVLEQALKAEEKESQEPDLPRRPHL